MTRSASGWVSLFLRVLVGATLFYAGFMKAVAPAAEFAAMIQAYRLIPAAWAMPLAQALPWIEMWVGTFLIFGYRTRASAALAALLFAMFLVALGSALARHIDLISCGCFGADALSPKKTIFMDAGLLVLTLVLFSLPLDRQIRALDSWLARD